MAARVSPRKPTTRPREMDSSLEERFRKAHQTPLALGCWALGGKGWGGQSEKNSLEVLETAYEKGIHHFDTAQAYGCSEELLGKFLEGRRENVFLASKVYPGLEPGSIRKTLDRSLSRLRSERIDLYYLHWPRDGLDIRSQVEDLMKAKDEGLIGAIGVSNYSVEQLQTAMEAGEVEFIQLGYHLFWRVIENALLPFCHKNGIRVGAYSALGQGILTGKFGRQLNFPQGDHRSKVLHFQPHIWPHVYDAVERLRPLEKRYGRPISHMALQWCAAREGIDFILAGARSSGQMEDNVGAFNEPVCGEVLEQMTQVSDELHLKFPEAGTIFKY